MSEDEKVKDVKKGMGSVLDTISSLKDANPKMLYGGVAALVIIVLIMMMSGGGGSTPQSSGVSAGSLVVGQNYVLRVANAYDKEATVRLVSTPGSMAAYDDTEKADREGCKHLPSGTPVVLKDFYSAYGKERAFAKVSVASGECEGTTGWTLSVNVGN